MSISLSLYLPLSLSLSLSLVFYILEYKVVWLSILFQFQARHCFTITCLDQKAIQFQRGIFAEHFSASQFNPFNKTRTWSNLYQNCLGIMYHKLKILLTWKQSFTLNEHSRPDWTSSKFLAWISLKHAYSFVFWIFVSRSSLYFHCKDKKYSAHWCNIPSPLERKFHIPVKCHISSQKAMVKSLLFL